MKLPSLPSLPALLAPFALALLAPAAALASGSDLSGVRSSLSVKGVLGALSPVEGAVVTGLLVFALGCAVAVVVARKLDRAADRASRPEPSEIAHFGEAPEPFYSYSEMQSGEYRGLRSARPAPSSFPTGAASSARLVIGPAAGSSARLAASQAQAELPADRASGETLVMEEDVRAAVRSATRKAPNTLVDELPRGADPDRTNEFPRDCNVATGVAALLRARTMLPPAAPAIRPIPISPPRMALAPANLQDLSYDDPATEMDLPSFPLEVQHVTYAQQSEIRLLSAYQLDADLDVAQTQAIRLVRHSS